MFLSDSLLTSQDIRCSLRASSAQMWLKKRHDCLILMKWQLKRAKRRIWCCKARPDIHIWTSLLIRGGCVLCSPIKLYFLAVLQWAQNYKTCCWKTSAPFSCLTHSIISLQTTPGLDGIFNLFVQRSLAYWGKKKKREREMSGEERWAVIETHLCQVVSDVLQ